MGKITDSEFKALISLLDDPDEEVLFHVSKRIRELGIRGVEKLETAWELAADELTQHLALNVTLHVLEFGQLGFGDFLFSLSFLNFEDHQHIFLGQRNLLLDEPLRRSADVGQQFNGRVTGRDLSPDTTNQQSILTGESTRAEVSLR